MEKRHVTSAARKTSEADQKSSLTTTDISANKGEVPLRRHIMDALERYRQVNDEIAEIVLRLGHTIGLQVAAERESERLKAERHELEEARRRKEAERQELWKRVADDGGPGTGARAVRTPTINPVVQSLIDHLRERGAEASAKDVARQFGIDEHNARQRLSKALKTGLVKRASRGRYRYAGPGAGSPSGTGRSGQAS